MTKDEIKQLIADKIAGQGSAIDAASVLPAILNGILDSIPDSPVVPAVTLDRLGILTPQEADKYYDAVSIVDNRNPKTRVYMRVVACPTGLINTISESLHATVEVVFSRYLTWGSDMQIESAECIVLFIDEQENLRLELFEL